MYRKLRSFIILLLYLLLSACSNSKGDFSEMSSTDVAVETNKYYFEENETSNFITELSDLPVITQLDDVLKEGLTDVTIETDKYYFESSETSNFVTEILDLSVTTQLDDVSYANVWVEPYLKYDWVNSSGRLIGTESYEMNGPCFFITIADLNLDNVPEAILSQKYSNRTVQINDVYGIENDKVVYKASFYGAFENSISIYEDKSTHRKFFMCYSNVFQSQTTTKSLILCSYTDDFSEFYCVPQLSINEMDKTIIYRQFVEKNEFFNCIDYLSVWDFGENEGITQTITEEQYVIENQNILYELIKVKESSVIKTDELVFNLCEDGEEWYSDSEKVLFEIKKVLNGYLEENKK